MCYKIIRLRQPGIENINLMLPLDHSASRKKKERCERIEKLSRVFVKKTGNGF